MIFAGFLLFFDPLKDGVQGTIQSLEKLGVQLKVITGDNKLVARHTGQVVGLGDAKVLTGAELDVLRDEALWHTVEEITIFAEVDPNEKERIILALKKRGHVVGYMGDSINDAPSLHSADVAKEAADLVLLKQDPSTGSGQRLDVLREGIVQGTQNFCQHAQVCLYGSQCQLQQYVQHGGHLAVSAVSSHASETDSTDQLPD